MPVNINDRILAQQQKMTLRLIDTAGQDITLTRPAQGVSDGAGSFAPSTAPDTELPTARRYLTGLTMVGRGVNQQPERWIVTALGKRYKEVLVMVGPIDDDVMAGDFWIDDFGNRCEVIFVHENRSYQTKAEVLVLA